MAEDDNSVLEDFVLISVLAKTGTFEYVVPSFPVFGAKLTEAKLQWKNCEEVMVFDCFACSCEALEHEIRTEKCSDTCQHKVLRT